jgi:hypothetical protein
MLQSDRKLQALEGGELAVERIKAWFSNSRERLGRASFPPPEPIPNEEIPSVPPLATAGPAPPSPRPIKEAWEQMRRSSPEELRDDALQMYRRDPLPFLAVVFLLGFGLGNLVLRLRDREEKPDDDL